MKNLTDLIGTSHEGEKNKSYLPFFGPRQKMAGKEFGTKDSPQIKNEYGWQLKRHVLFAWHQIK